MNINNIVIKAEHLSMVYKKPVMQEGKLGMLKDMFKRQYSYYEALSDVSVSVREGEILGYIGPNGAGKSTTIKILTGVMHPTSGSVTVNGISPHKKRIENGKSIALVSGQRSNLYWDLPVYDSFELHKRIYKIPDKQYDENMDMFQQLLNIQSFFKTPVRQLSLGQRIMSDFALAFLHNPSVAYLDEPTIGLDISAKENIIKFLKQINQQRKVTMMITSHDLSDIDNLCEKILILDKGKNIYEGPKDKLIKEYCNEQCTIVMEIENLHNIKDLSILQFCQISKNGNKVNISFSRQKTSPAEIMMNIMNKGYNVKDFTILETSLEDAIRVIYRNAKNNVL
ncbi:MULTISPECIES: ABC transporter ATP-binding protein [Clostridium]|jgi:ABC-2 type transport system ATP-binding protein|uniref:ABC transporter ATP-binding protein n=1 Tax=Clostridium saccharoperbutylacetonicum N1-4(HMT) TaxID=931276 RepID=M1MCI3_9CLOT|nr:MULTISPECIES: ATP-binding cassette domain-containing protein [Clostridium]AGF54128.1 ABC transporter ATP-binding protein [Clostridium saccharoperbutylacetonicum N1-4(HMT)]AQR93030.1 methionine import ATP-binding protein MetN [Clostridium saccharoperbutylacetonicum]NRT59358.1 ABC-2 type transport system ATP-binding protein [Clostridium saccharoperbutylacetonicum]NSB28549.1 ABC-2 type transport system ATP-binding protein [Clostridium saccharoperbutylacetonicum]NSB34441.1 ABC-2 type transport 